MINSISIVQANLQDSSHCQAVVRLITHYMSGSMGGSSPLPKDLEPPLIEGLKESENTFLLLACLNGEYIALTTCFINFSTFKAKPYINVHDIVVSEEYRGRGVGRMLLQRVIDIAAERDYCKVTLEVRNDNHNAMHLYKSLGFYDSDPPMYFWTREV